MLDSRVIDWMSLTMTLHNIAVAIRGAGISRAISIAQSSRYICISCRGSSNIITIQKIIRRGVEQIFENTDTLSQV